MKFINIITKHTKGSLEDILGKLSKAYIDIIKEIYLEFEHIEYTTTNDWVGMYAAIEENTLKKLQEVYNKCGVNFTTTDITKEVLFSDDPKLSDVLKQGDLMFMCRKFRRENITVDIILDKLSERGVESLSFTDKKLLESI
jgi:hypothetical protein